MHLKPLFAFALLALAHGLPAFAHAGFLMPVADDTGESGEIILMASFSDRFPVEAIALKSDDWTIVTPEGARMAFDRFAETANRTLLQVALPAPGTYRLSTGERLGRKGEAARLDGELVRLGADGVGKDALPDGTPVLTAQTATLSDIYIARGEPGAMPQAALGRLEIHPASNPAALKPGDALSARILFDGAPLAGAPVTVFTPSNSKTEGAEDSTLVTGEDGTIALPLTEPGPHLLMIRHLADAPDGAETDVRSYTTVLTVVVG